MSEATPTTAPAPTNPPAQESTPSTPNSVSPELPRPALADRQCDQTQQQPAKQTGRKNGGQSVKQVQRAGTFTNSRLPRTSSQSNLPRGRSFQGVRPLSPQQQAQEHYFQRKAAKAYAERKRAKAEREAKEKGEAGTNDVINITVDDKGVKIDNGKGTSQGNGQGMGGRRNSRSRMSRSNSRQWNNRTEDKENRRESGQRNADGEIEAYFSRKRGSVDNRRRESFGGNGASWDGSMPKRQGSKSFIESRNQRRESMKLKSDAEGPAKAEGEDKKVKEDPTDTAEPSMEKDENNPGKNEKETPAEALSTPKKKVDAGVSPMAKNPDTPTEPNTSGSGVEDESKPKLEPSDHEEQELSGASPSESGALESQKAPLQGKWCEDCAGLGLHIAALLSELEKQRSSSDLSADNPSASSGSKKGWKNIVLGDSKSKSSSEKARLQQEVNVLKASVDFLYKKIEQMEAKNSQGSK